MVGSDWTRGLYSLLIDATHQAGQQKLRQSVCSLVQLFVLEATDLDGNQSGSINSRVLRMEIR